MAKTVVVVGGGVAGLSAALTASRYGAKITLVESSKKVGLSKALMPLLISEGWTEDDILLPQAAALSETDIQVRTGETATLIEHEEKIIRVVPSPSRSDDDHDTDDRGGGKGINFDSVVICTGAASQVPLLRGISKPNVFVLREPANYLELSTGLDALQTIVVSGPIPLSLKLSEILADRGKRVLVYCGKEGLTSQFSEPFAAAIRHEISLRNKQKDEEEGRWPVVLVDDSVDSVLGVQRVEAVTSAGSVQTCDGVVLIPRSVPAFPTVDCEKGRNGGLLVDASMSTNLRNVFAAGDSAEIKFKSSSVPARLYSTSRMGGEVAGINAAGGKVAAAPSWAVEQTYFGLEFCSAGLGEVEAMTMGLDATTETQECGARSDDGEGSGDRRKTLVSLVYDRATHQVYGLQAAGWRASSLSSVASMIVSLGLVVEQLVRVESPYSPGSSYEISPIALTAGKILEKEGA